MNLNYDSLSSNLFNTEVNKIPEPYRTKFIQIVQDSQKDLEHKTYTGDAGAGLLSLTVDNKGQIKSLNIDKTLFEQNKDYGKLNSLISSLTAIAHVNAIENIRKAMDEQLAILYSKVLKLVSELVEDKEG